MKRDKISRNGDHAREKKENELKSEYRMELERKRRERERDESRRNAIAAPMKCHTTKDTKPRDQY